MDKIIRIGAVSYLNTKPLLYGIEHHPIISNISLVQDYPARIASMLLNDKIDVGLVPVAIIPRLTKSFIISDYCIGSVKEVASVCLFSEVPLSEITTVILDYQSHTSVALAKILFEKYWKLNVEFVAATENFRNAIKDTTAAVVIGDRAFEQRTISRFYYDLSAAWINFTQLPFVFATWVANKKLPETFIALFNEANKMGLQNIDEVVARYNSPLYDLKTYYTENISYDFTIEKQKGLKKFLEYLNPDFSIEFAGSTDMSDKITY